MAEVYLARHGEMSGYQTAVVVKRILPHLARDTRFVEMFLDEGRIAAALDHPNVARVIEVGHAEQEYFMAMELVQGESLASLVAEAKEKNVRISPSMASFIIAHAAAGLHHAHTLTDSSGQALSIVHRDVSPQNILVSFEGAVKVIDFGVARALGRVTQTKTGGVKGKIAYMSPEQARGEPLDQRTDVFALGVVLWELLSGRRLFARDSELATMRAIIDEPYPAVTDVVEVKPTLAAIVKKALEPDANQRFETAQDMEIALEKYIATEGFLGTGDLAREMKALFPEEHLRWKRWVHTALALPTPIDLAAHRSLPVEQDGGVPTRILRQQHRPGSASGSAMPGATPWPAEPQAHSTTAAPGTAAPSRRLWTYLAMAWVILVAGGVGVGFLYTRSRAVATPSVPAAVPVAVPVAAPVAAPAPTPVAAPVPAPVPPAAAEPIPAPAPAAQPDDMSEKARAVGSPGPTQRRSTADRDRSRIKKSGKKAVDKTSRPSANPGFKPNPF